MRHKAIAIFNFFRTEIKDFQEVRGVIKDDYKIIFDKIDTMLGFYFDIQVYLMENLIHRFSINSDGGMCRHFPKDRPTYDPDQEILDMILKALNLYEPFEKSPITVLEIDPIPPNKNPYRFDHSRMGMEISKEWEIMFHTPAKKKINKVVLVHKPTGRRFDLDLYEAEKALSVVSTPQGNKLINSQGTELMDQYGIADVE